MTLQKDMDDLRIAWHDLGYAIARETRLLKLANRLGMKPRPWVLQAEQREAQRISRRPGAGQS